MPKKKLTAFDPVHFSDNLKNLRDLLITNIILIGQVPSVMTPTDENDSVQVEIPLRAKSFSERLVEMGVDECSSDSEGNPIGIIKGADPSLPPIILAAHLDTSFPVPPDSFCTLTDDSITGPGLMDNSVAAGVLLSVPEICRRLDIKFQSDIVIAGFNESLGRANLKGVRSFLREWGRPVRAALCLEGGELGRLNYFSDAMSRLEIDCSILDEETWEFKHGVNTILVLNEIINRILEIRIPQRPETRIIIGTVSGGVKFGNRAMASRLGLEIQSTSDTEVERISELVEDIVTSIAYEQRAAVSLDHISSVRASNLGYGHPLVKTAFAVLNDLNVEPIIESSESELSIFLSGGIPAITIGLTEGYNYHLESATMNIKPLFSGIAQLFSLMKYIDEGVCDEQ